MTELTLAVMFTIINLIFWVWLFRKFSLVQVQDFSGEADRSGLDLLVVISARNEAENLKQNLPVILEQNHSNFGVLVIDDHSGDDSVKVLEKLSGKYRHLRFRKNEIHLGKKRTLQKVLSEESASHLIFTDADCKPASKDWLNHLGGNFTEQKKIILGHGPYKRQAGLLNAFVRFENFMTALQYFSYALAGMPYMGVGRNLAYQKSLFDSVGGFSKHLNTLSGDDDLFVNQVAAADNVAIQVHPAAFMFSGAPVSWKQFLKQKRRHISTSVKYKRIHQFMLSLYAASHLMFYVMIFFVGLKAALFLWFARYLIIIMTNHRAFFKLDEKDLLLYFPLLDLMMFFYYTFMSVYSLWPGKIKW